MAKTKYNTKRKKYNLYGLSSNIKNATANPGDNESNDCVVQGISFACNLPYKEVRDTLYYASSSSYTPHRKNRGWFAGHYHRALSLLNITYREENRIETTERAARYDSWRGHTSTTTVVTGETLAHFLDNEGRTGSWLVVTNRHMVGIVNGVPHHVMSFKPGWGRKQRIRKVYHLGDTSVKLKTYPHSKD
jgi:hypothetical protein